MTVQEATDPQAWDAFLAAQQFRPFLQSWMMGEVFRDIGQKPIRLEVRNGDELSGICLAIVVPAKRGRHLAIQYGPVLSSKLSTTHCPLVLQTLIDELTRIAKQHRCSFIRMSPFWPEPTPYALRPTPYPSPLHLLAEHVWYLPLVTPNPWEQPQQLAASKPQARTEEELLMAMRKTTRNLIRRAEKEGVEIVASPDPVKDVEAFITLHDETRKRHHFTPYSNAFFRAQVRRFSARNECTVYLARYQGEVIASSIHMHAYGETSYHHGASTQKFAKIPSSYLLQWTAIRDAMKRGDHIYNFWGIAPEGVPKHPFAGVTLFKTGFGGAALPLVHCMDFPLSPSYTLTRIFEHVRRWRRGF
ncbi:MAG: peptidoglycan bridge formation glycyltransferase FemA/FemB family protein [Candidatus Peribacteraceae bacterium]|nr:peptidoglycan bridge formation glycyltransferase FemA/FemB family protein [Candidatus Peribacteraceae bacterium]MDD5074890.1 peptidoglycan bridge formation glycyltransferase FemA/FemB family protein [Candidatus Peribacteraceae bacterium]